MWLKTPFSRIEDSIIVPMSKDIEIILTIR